MGVGSLFQFYKKNHRMYVFTIKLHQHIKRVSRNVHQQNHLLRLYPIHLYHRIRFVSKFFEFLNQIQIFHYNYNQYLLLLSLMGYFYLDIHLNLIHYNPYPSNQSPLM